MANWFQDIWASQKPAPDDPAAAGGGGVNWYAEGVRLHGSRAVSDAQAAAERFQQERALIDDPKREVGAMDVAKASFASDDAEATRYYASKLYPNEPIDKAVQRFGDINGVMFHVADDGKAYRVTGPRDVIPRTLASMAGPAIPAAAGVAAGVLTAPMAATGVGLAGSVAATGAASAGGEYVRQKLGDAFLGKAATNEINPIPVAIEGVTGGAGQGIGLGVGKLAERKAVADISRFDPARTKAAYDAAKNAGIPITPAEATNLASLKAQQKRLGNTTTTSNQMGDFYEGRNERIHATFNDFLDGLSRKGDAEIVGAEARDAAQGAIRDERKRLSDIFQPQYEETYKQPFKRTPKLLDLADRPATGSALRSAWTRIANDPAINLDDMKRVLGPIMGDNPEQLSDAQLARRLTQAIGSRPTEFRLLDYVKRGLDDVVEANPGLKEVRDLRNAWRTELKTANPDYAKVLEDYTREVEPLEDLLNGTVGVLSKAKDTNLVTQIKGLLSTGTKSPATVVAVRDAIKGQDPRAWQGVKRMFIQSLADDALKVTEKGEIANPAGKLYKAFANPNMRSNLQAALSPQEYSRFAELMDVYRTASRVQTIGSDTEWNRAANEIARNQARGPVAKIIKNLNPMTLLKSADEFLTDRALAKNDLASLSHVTSNDPQAIAAMRELRNLRPGEWQWRALLGFIVSRGGPPALTATASGASAMINGSNPPDGKAQ
jgi:hypothetical protein